MSCRRAATFTALSKCGENGVIPKAYVADDDLASLNAYSELDWRLQLGRELVVHIFDV